MELRIIKFPDRKRRCICAYDEETNSHYVIAYFINDSALKLFRESIQKVGVIKDFCLKELKDD